MILEDFSHAAIQAAIEDNLSAFVSFCTQATGGEIKRDAALTWAMNGAPISFLNGVLRTDLTPEEADEAITTTLALFEAHQQPMLWRVGPSSRPDDLAARLEAHGLALLESSSGMAADLQKLNESRPAPADLVIEPVKDRAAIQDWLSAFVTGFEFPEAGDTEEFVDFFAAWMLNETAPGSGGYLARLRGTPVATSFLFPAAGVAGIYAVATVPAARQQGIGTAITLAALRQARALGYQIGILHASEAGFSVYRHLGFQTYCAILEYEWQPG